MVRLLDYEAFLAARFRHRPSPQSFTCCLMLAEEDVEKFKAKVVKVDFKYMTEDERRRFVACIN
jgi:hypothetical protein